MTPYDDVAEIVGAQLATPGGGGELTALTDATLIAHGAFKGGTVSVMHDGITYQYQVRCFDDLSRLPSRCGGFVDRAEVSVLWGGAVNMPRFDAATTARATWQIRGLRGDHAWVTGTSMSWFDARFASGTSDERSILVQTFKDTAFAWNASSMAVLGGSQSADIKTVQEDARPALTGVVTFDRADRVTLTLDDRIYWIDPTSGATTVATDGELY
ncbi:MAG TPA: hypothetical protein VLB44_27540 [Kofleriaceae bacterium]|nr:hypothetical protein [Kofleriaceae bacterium]